VKTKWVAEKLVEDAYSMGYLRALTIHRPAFISGHYNTGHCNPDDTVCRLVMSMCQKGIICVVNWDLSFCRVFVVCCVQQV
jgi:thioester reductase-like protein